VKLASPSTPPLLHPSTIADELIRRRPHFLAGNPSPGHLDLNLRHLKVQFELLYLFPTQTLAAGDRSRRNPAGAACLSSPLFWAGQGPFCVDSILSGAFLKEFKFFLL
jgi:hypothetical protein